MNRFNLHRNNLEFPFLIAEIGINHNGDLEIAKQLIDISVEAGCNAVKFQKRNLGLVYFPEELDKSRESPWGNTNHQQKAGLEFSKEQYDEIDSYCRQKGIEWLASAWDLESQEFLSSYDLKYNKIASPMLTVVPLLHKVAKEKKYTFISTGMSTLEEIDEAVKIFRKHNCPFELMHCNSSYPSNTQEANLHVIKVLKERYDCDIGYSGHEAGIEVSLAATALGATSIERHITLDRSMYGSDQSASLEGNDLKIMAKNIRTISGALGDGIKRIYDSEIPARKKLSTPYWYKTYLEKRRS